VNTKCNLPAQVELYATPGNEYHFHFMAKGGGSANKTFLFQETKALLNEAKLLQVGWHPMAPDGNLMAISWRLMAL
jgi:tartrate dehydratase alpha subunit/fumarate hydratase class I-like protein